MFGVSGSLSTNGGFTDGGTQGMSPHVSFGMPTAKFATRATVSRLPCTDGTVARKVPEWEPASLLVGVTTVSGV